MSRAADSKLQPVVTTTVELAIKHYCTTGRWHSTGYVLNWSTIHQFHKDILEDFAYYHLDKTPSLHLAKANIPQKVYLHINTYLWKDTKLKAE